MAKINAPPVDIRIFYNLLEVEKQNPFCPASKPSSIKVILECTGYLLLSPTWQLTLASCSLQEIAGNSWNLVQLLQLSFKRSNYHI